MLRCVTGIAFGVLMLASPLGADARTLTLKGADRIIDLAYTAELGGDYRGARAAVRTRLQEATLSEEAPARARLRNWLIGQARRNQAFEEYGKTATGYWIAYQTLQDSGFGRADLMWRRAVRDVPELAADFTTLAVVDVKFERVVGLEGSLGAWDQHLRKSLARAGIRLNSRSRARYQVRINLDAADSIASIQRWRVTAEGSYVLLNRQDENQVIGSFSRRRAVVRRVEARARNFAIRRVLDDMAWGLVFKIREDVLRDVAAP